MPLAGCPDAAGGVGSAPLVAFRILVLDWLVAIAVAALLLPATNLLAPAATIPMPGHGDHFAAMARDPWAFDGAFPHRVLWPALAQLAGAFGVGPVAFSHGCNGALLAVVFWFCRRRGAGWLGSLLVAAAIAASGAVLVYRLLPCISDSLNLMLLLFAVHAVRRPAIYWGLVLLAALSHEMALLFTPFFWWLRCRSGGAWLRDGVWLAAVGAAYAGLRALFVALGPAAVAGSATGSYDLSYYFRENFWVPWGLPAMWVLWWMVTLAEFGPLLAVGVAAARRRELGLGGPFGGVIYLGCVLSLMALAYDMMRFASYAMLPVVLGGVALVRTNAGRWSLAALVVAAAFSHRLAHPEPTQFGGRGYHDAAAHIGALQQQGFSLATPGDAFVFGRELFARMSTYVGEAAVATIVIVALGVFLARYVGTASAAGSTPRTQRNASP